MNWIVHIILLILGEIRSKGSNLTSLLLVVFAEVNTKALNIKSYQPWQKHFHIVTLAFYLLWQKMLKPEGWLKIKLLVRNLECGTSSCKPLLPNKSIFTGNRGPGSHSIRYDFLNIVDAWSIQSKYYFLQSIITERGSYWKKFWILPW